MPEIFRLALPTPFPVGPVNTYVLKGSPLALIDPGPLYPPAREALTEGLARLGLGLGDFELVLLTHPHIDHYGLAREVAERSGAKVAAHVEAVARVKAGLRKGQAGEREAMEQVLDRAGAPAGYGETLFRHWAAADTLAATVDVDRGLADGETVEGGGVTWRAISTPGHSPGALCFYDEAGRRLISGDHLLPEISSNAIMEFREARPEEVESLGTASAHRPLGRNGPVLVRQKSLLIYIESLRRMERLEVSEVLPGHGEPFTGHRALIAERMRRYETRKAAIAAILKDRGPSPAFLLARTLFPEQTEPMGQFLALSEVLGHLDLLEAEGRVRVLPGRDPGGEPGREVDLYSLT